MRTLEYLVIYHWHGDKCASPRETQSPLHWVILVRLLASFDVTGGSFALFSPLIVAVELRRVSNLSLEPCSMMEGFADPMPVERRLVTRCHVCVMIVPWHLINVLSVSVVGLSMYIQSTSHRVHIHPIATFRTCHLVYIPTSTARSSRILLQYVVLPILPCLSSLVDRFFTASKHDRSDSVCLRRLQITDDGS